MLEWFTSVGGVIGALIVIGGAIFSIYKWGEKFLLWILKKIYGHAGGLRIVKARSKGTWGFKDEQTALLSSSWYATYIGGPSVVILTVQMSKPKKHVDGGLIQIGGNVPSELPLNTICVSSTPVEFDARLQIPASYATKNEDLKAEIIFTDSFNNPQRKKVVFAFVEN